MALIFDIETDALLKDLTKVHSLVIYNSKTDEITSCTDYNSNYTPIETGVKMLMEADEVAGHNIIKFDLPALNKVYPYFKLKQGAEIFDTLLAGKLLYPDIGENYDIKNIKRGLFPKYLYGRHSLEAWGFRTKTYKGDYCKQEDCWTHWTDAMQSYCEQDVMVTKTLYQMFKAKNISKKALELETRFSHIISLQEQRGIQFNKDKAVDLAAHLKARQLELEKQLREVFPDEVIEETFIPKANNKTRGYIKGVPFIKRTTVPFKPSSRQQTAERLMKLYNWKPTEFTDTGQPKIDDEILKTLPYKEAPLLAEYFTVTKLLGYISEGTNAWLKCEKAGVIYGAVDTIGAVTRRCTHHSPNLAQTPNSSAPYGRECRELFEARKGFILVGTDAKALELRCLAHYMKDEDYTHEILNGDIHTKNQIAAGLPTRDSAKTFIYGFLYGAGDEKIGQLIGKGKKEGKAIKAKFLNNIPALANLISRVKHTAEQRGYLYSVDRHKLKVRESYKALNTLFQSAGAIVMKQALVLLYDWCCKKGWITDSFYLKPDNKVYFVLNIHDEYQAEVTPDIEEEYKELAVRAIQEAGKIMQFNCPLDGDVKTGKTWADTH